MSPLVVACIFAISLMIEYLLTAISNEAEKERCEISLHFD
jgi:hypothetical protein